MVTGAQNIFKCQIPGRKHALLNLKKREKSHLSMPDIILNFFVQLKKFSFLSFYIVNEVLILVEQTTGNMVVIIEFTCFFKHFRNLNASKIRHGLRFIYKTKHKSKLVLVGTTVYKISIFK